MKSKYSKSSSSERCRPKSGKSSERLSARSSAQLSDASVSEFKEKFHKLPPISGATSAADWKRAAGSWTPDSRRTSSDKAPSPDRKHNTGRLLSFPQATAEIRRKSFPFPVTAWLSRNHNTGDEDGSRTPKALHSFRHTRSHAEIEHPPPLLRRSSSWKVSMLVSRAKKKFSVPEKTEKRRISLSDFVRVAIMKRSDSDKKKMVRDLKRKAQQHKVTIRITIACIDIVLLLYLSCQ